MYPFHEDDVTKIEIRGVPRGVKVIIEEKGTLLRVVVRVFGNIAQSLSLASSTQHREKTLVVWAKAPKSDDYTGKVVVNVPVGYKRRTTVHR